MKKLNPSVNDYLKEKPNVTVLGLWWSGYWRFMCSLIIIVGIIIFAKNIFTQSDSSGINQVPVQIPIVQ